MYGLVANVISDRALRTGARVWILWWHGDAEHPKVRGLSKSGRLIRKYTHFKRLRTYRVAWIPHHVEPDIAPEWKMETAEMLQRGANTLNTMWAGIRSYTRDGAEIRHPGMPVSEAFRRAAALNTNHP